MHNITVHKNYISLGWTDRRHQVLSKYIWNWQMYTSLIMTAQHLQHTWQRNKNKKNKWLPNSPVVSPTLSHLGAMLEKYLTSSQSLRWLTSWKSPCKPSGKSCQKNTLTRQRRISSSTWLPTCCQYLECLVRTNGVSWLQLHNHVN